MTDCNNNTTDLSVETPAKACSLPRVAPRQEVHETEDGWRIRVELPGVPPEALKLEVVQRTLTLEATPAEPSLPEGLRPLRQEYRRSLFAQRWRLPARVDLDAVGTSYRHGLLTIELPYSAPERRTIEVVTE